MTRLVRNCIESLGLKGLDVLLSVSFASGAEDAQRYCVGVDNVVVDVPVPLRLAGEQLAFKVVQFRGDHGYTVILC